MKTRVYHHPTDGMAVASRQDGCRKVFVHRASGWGKHTFRSFAQADRFLVSLGYVESKHA